MERHADLFYFRAKSSEGGHGVTHRGIGYADPMRQTNVSSRTPIRKPFAPVPRSPV